MALERKALIFNVQKYNLHDGPGIRTLVFFKGCPLRCQWCSNPEGQKTGHEILFKAESCVACGACAEVCPAGVHVMQGDRHLVRRDVSCLGCRACEQACLHGAVAVAGERKDISEIMRIVREDLPFYQSSGGGVTLSGGEVLMQPEAALSLLSACRREGISTAVETCGFTRPEVMEAAAKEVDLFLYDIKHMDPKEHHRWTGVRNETVLENLTMLLERRRRVRARIPLLKGVNDGEENLRATADFLEPWKDLPHFDGLDILPYHRLGVGKYAQVGLEYPFQGDPRLSEEDLARVEGYFRKRGFRVSLVRH